jgi:hypothetical protein
MPLTPPTPFYGDLPLVNAKNISVFGTTSAGVNVEPYVVPFGRKAIWAAHAYQNPTASAGQAATRVKLADGSTYRDVQPVFSFSATQGGAAQNAVLLNAGERPVVAAPTVSGVNVSLRVVEFDDSPFLLRASADLAAGDNVLYTVPDGFNALLLAATSPPSPGFGISPHILVSNVSGSTRVFQLHIFPVGVGASSNATRWSNSTGVTNNNFSTLGATGARNVLSAGEKLVVNSDGSGSGLWAFASLFLFPA